jgi:hypothetical protein
VVAQFQRPIIVHFSEKSISEPSVFLSCFCLDFWSSDCQDIPSHMWDFDVSRSNHSPTLPPLALARPRPRPPRPNPAHNCFPGKRSEVGLPCSARPGPGATEAGPWLGQHRLVLAVGLPASRRFRSGSGLAWNSWGRASAWPAPPGPGCRAAGEPQV